MVASVVIVPVRGMSCIDFTGAEVRYNPVVIVPVRGMSCIFPAPETPVSASRRYRPREGYELHQIFSAHYDPILLLSSP